MKGIFFSAFVVVASLSLSGCLEDLGMDDSSDYSSSYSSSSCGSYVSIVTSSETSRANQCGVQTSSQFGAAEASLSAAIASCEQGDSSGADQYYSQYKTQVKLARKVMDSLCGGSSSSGSGSSGASGFEDTSSAKYYNMCVKSTSTKVYAVCSGKYQYSDHSCGSGYSTYTYTGNYTSSSACLSARDSWLNKFK